MSASKQRGYQCEFVESVPEHFLCSKCTLVARRLCFTSCCGESYCHGCITSSQTEGHPCPSCGEDKFTALDQIKFQKKIKCRQVYCSMKGRGCSWTGSLVDQDTHLDPQGDNSCQYVNVQCPLNCQLAIPKCKLEDHMTKECGKINHTCQHCGFKATYGEVVDVHLPQCKYVPVQCPNFCGVTCEREDLELHMKTCRLEEVVCQFSGVGCEDKFLREREDEHVRLNILQHVSLTASAFIQEKMLMDQKLLSQNIELEEKLCQQEDKIGQQEDKIGQQEDKIGQQEDRIRTLEEKLIAQELLLAGQGKQVEVLKKHLEDQNEKIKALEEKPKTINTQSDSLPVHEKHIAKAQNMPRLLEVEQDLSRLFVIENFRNRRLRYRQGTSLNSPSMLSKRNGYKFYLQLYPNGCHNHDQSLCVTFKYARGDCDSSLKWPVIAEFTLVLSDREKRPWFERHPNVSNWSRVISIGDFFRISGALSYFHTTLSYFHTTYSNDKLIAK